MFVLIVDFSYGFLKCHLSVFKVYFQVFLVCLMIGCV